MDEHNSYPTDDESHDADGLPIARICTDVKAQSVSLHSLNDESLDIAVNTAVTKAVLRIRGGIPELESSFKAWVVDVTVGDDGGYYALPASVLQADFVENMTGTSAANVIDGEGPQELDTKASCCICMVHAALETGHRIAIRVNDYTPTVTILRKSDACLNEGSVMEIQKKVCELTKLRSSEFRVIPSHACRSYGWEPERAPDLKSLNVKKYVCIKVRLPTLAAYSIVSRNLGLKGIEVVESNMDATLRWFDETGISPCSWITVRTQRVDERRYTFADVECTTSISEITPCDSDTIPPIMICSFDCEMLRYKMDDAIPQASEESDIVAVVSVALNRHGSPASDRRNFVFSIGPDAPSETHGTTIYRFKTELGRINALRDLIVASGALVITGYNILNFDLPYLDTRAKLLKSDRFWGFGGFITRRACIKPRSLSSSALGKMETHTVVIDGILVIDILEEVRRRFQLNGYSLKLVGRHFLQAGPKIQLLHGLGGLDAGTQGVRVRARVHGDDRREVCRFLHEHHIPDPIDDVVHLCDAGVNGEFKCGDFVCLVAEDGHLKLVKSLQKIDMPISRMFEIIKGVVDGTSTPDKSMSEVDEYADVDALLPLELMSVLHVLTSLSEVARVTSCRISQQLIRGQGIKVFSAYVWFLHRQLPVPYVYTGSPDVSDIEYIGATVLTPKPGYYTDPIITLDFASLYPSIMRTWNLCMSSLDVHGLAVEYNAPHEKFIIEPLGMRWRRVSKVSVIVMDAHSTTRNVSELLLAKRMDVKKELECITFTRDEWEKNPCLHNVARLAVDAGVSRGCRAWFEPAEPVVDTFVTAETCEGILPKLLKEILMNRKRVKKKMALTTDHIIKTVLDQRQLALKILANSIYGVTGASKGYLACPQIARTTTFNGRKLIEDTKTQVLLHPVSQGRVHAHVVASGGRVKLTLRAQEKCSIVYGDTDSVMVLAPGRSVQNAWDIGVVIATFITKYFPGVIELECEQIKCPAIFRDAKKNYIACVWEPNKNGLLVRESEMLAKGNEIARRDHPPYVRESLKRALEALMFGGCELVSASDVHAGVFKDSLKLCHQSVKADSVTGDMPMLIRKCSSGFAEIVSFDALSLELSWVMQPDGKDVAHVEADVWSDEGWTAIHSVIRHRVTKPLFRVVANGGVVVCTEDHSLLTDTLKAIKPYACKVGTVLCTSWPSKLSVESRGTHRIDVTNAAILGMFLGIGTIVNKPDQTPQWTLHWDSFDHDVLVEYQTMLQQRYPLCNFMIVEALPVQAVPTRSLIAQSNDGEALQRLVDEFQEFGFDAMDRPHVPECLYTATQDICEEYLGGIYDACGYYNDNGAMQMVFEHAVTAQGVYALLRSMSRSVTIQMIGDMYMLTTSRGALTTTAGTVRSIHAIPHAGETYVYDLTTANHHFAAGVGSLVVHNTDRIVNNEVPLEDFCVSKTLRKKDDYANPFFPHYHVAETCLDVNYRPCAHAGCTSKEPYFNLSGESRGRFCEAHREDLLDVPCVDRKRWMDARFGLKWKQHLPDAPTNTLLGNDSHIQNDKLSEALKGGRKTDFSREEFNEFGIRNLKHGDLVQSCGVFFTPSDNKEEWLHENTANVGIEWPTNVRVRYFFRQPTVVELHPKKMHETRELKLSQLAEDPETSKKRPWRHKVLAAFCNSLKRPLSGGWDNSAIDPIFKLFEDASIAMEHEIKRQRTIISMFGTGGGATSANDANFSMFKPLPPRLDANGTGPMATKRKTNGKNVARKKR